MKVGMVQMWRGSPWCRPIRPVGVRLPAVSLPVRPTCTVIPITCVTPDLAVELVGDSPARGAAGIAEALLGGMPVYFENHTVDLIAQARRAELLPCR